MGAAFSRALQDGCLRLRPGFAVTRPYAVTRPPCGPFQRLKSHPCVHPFPHKDL